MKWTSSAARRAAVARRRFVGENSPSISNPPLASPRRRPTRLHAFGVSAVLLAAAGGLWVNWQRHSALAKETRSRQKSLAEGPFVRVSKVAFAPAIQAISLPGEGHPFSHRALFATGMGSWY